MRSFVTTLVNVLYPLSCSSCSSLLGRDSNSNLCKNCFHSCLSIESPYCDKCGQGFEGNIQTNFVCGNCRELNLSFRRARTPYKNTGAIRKMLHRFKYDKARNLRIPLVQIVLDDFDALNYDSTKTTLVPIPLHPQRKRLRTYNQAEELMNELIKNRKAYHYVNALKRIRSTDSQTGLTRSERLQNLKKAFVINEKTKNLIQDQSIVLVDDVLTTGATAEACTQVLLKNGAKEVDVFTVARG